MKVPIWLVHGFLLLVVVWLVVASIGMYKKPTWENIIYATSGLVMAAVIGANVFKSIRGR